MKTLGWVAAWLLGITLYGAVAVYHAAEVALGGFVRLSRKQKAKVLGAVLLFIGLVCAMTFGAHMPWYEAVGCLAGLGFGCFLFGGCLEMMVS